MGRPEYSTITIRGPHNEVLSTMRIVDNTSALTGPVKDRTNLVDILQPREVQMPLKENDPWLTEISLPKETRGLTPEQAAAEITRRTKQSVLQTILDIQEDYRKRGI